MKKYYAQARHKEEAKIWPEDMTVLQKVNALAGDIRTTTHYPGNDGESGSAVFV